MGRSKATAPKRRRIEDESAEKEAIQTLMHMPPEQVEAAAAEATRDDLKDWPKAPQEQEETQSKSNDGGGGCKDDSTLSPSSPGATKTTSTDSTLPYWVAGLGISHSLPKNHYEALKSLHEIIKQQQTLNDTWSPWSGSATDPRKRAFGFLPNTLGYQEKVRSLLDISTPWKETTTTKTIPPAESKEGKEKVDDNERKQNNKAMVILDKIPDGVMDAIDYVCQHFSSQIPNSSIKPYLNYSNLIAAQPNLHCGRHLLPSHVDHPLKDGFGIVIVTIGIYKSGTVFIRDHTNTKGITLHVGEGQAYMLSDQVRDACAHGILADIDDADRESLNLRFGLHDYSVNESSSATASSSKDDPSSGNCNVGTGGNRNLQNDDAKTNSCSEDGISRKNHLPVIPARQVLQYWEADTSSMSYK